MRSRHSPRKTIRLPSEAYSVVGTMCSITIAVQDRRPVFADPTIASAAIQVLREHSTANAVPVYAYCIMPDHVHLVIGPSPTCDIISFVGQFKNLAQRAAWSYSVRGAFWQKSFWDHFLREEEDIEAVVSYIMHNPVRSGLVTDWRDYPFCGSLEFEL
ncbi:MAG: hypothetical protein HW403_1236 [Dehalococcoidia bacterium]|nr:hypothetical protein [Dehalococcoidia bacterium]